MCGIAGFIGGLDPQQGQQALFALAHRGPDGIGEWYSAEDRVWLGHRRLAIIDLEGGKQPLANEDNSLWLTFNGCIYNYLELRATLIEKGYQFRTQSDTEVIVHAYAEYGEDCIKHFNGMFAFAVWDARRKRLFCARDRMGEKPFYYYAKDKTFLFASEIKALLAMGVPECTANMKVLQEYLTFQLLLDDQTLFSGIKKLLPGHCLMFEPASGTLKIWQYWDLDFTWDEGQTEASYIDQLQDLLYDAVRLRLRSDVMLGSHLSGGLDSSAVACIANRLLPDSYSLKTFTGAFQAGPQFDETRYARIVSQHLGTDAHEIYPTSEDFRRTLGKIIYHMDEPAAGPGVFPQFIVSEYAAQHVKVVLGGQGGDEIFAGYTRYLVCYLENTLRGAILDHGNKAHYASVLADMASGLEALAQYLPMLKSFWREGLFEAPERRYFQLMDRSANAKEIFNQELFDASDNLMFKAFNQIFHGSNARTFLERMLYFDTKIHLPALLHVEDRTSMAWGLESRVPLLDHRIAELMTSIPPVVKFKGGQPKYLFRQAVRGIVPPDIMARKDKMGYPVPLSQWYKGELKNYVKEVLLDEKALSRGLFNGKALEKAIMQEQEFGRAIWGALCLELWFQTFIDTPPSVTLNALSLS